MSVSFRSVWKTPENIRSKFMGRKESLPLKDQPPVHEFHELGRHCQWLAQSRWHAPSWKISIFLFKPEDMLHLLQFTKHNF
jgi:hypothetical protein